MWGPGLSPAWVQGGHVWSAHVCLGEGVLRGPWHLLEVGQIPKPGELVWLEPGPQLPGRVPGASRGGVWALPGSASLGGQTGVHLLEGLSP